MRLRSAALLFALSTAPVAPAHAFCGFFVSGADAKLSNNASQVVLMRKDNRTVMTMSNTYQGPPQDFAMVVPVPTVLQKDDVKTLPPDVFEHIDQLSAPRLVEYWEQDPCYIPPPVYPSAVARMTADGGESEKKMSGGGHGVTIEAKFAVGEYQILILSAKQATGLETWLKENKYRIPEGASTALAPYIASGMKFFVAKVDISKIRRDAHGAVVLSPLRFSYESNELRVPVRLGLLNAAGKQDLIVYVLHPESRFESSNYPNVFAPTNLEVVDEVRNGFGSFYAQLFDETLAAHGNKAIVTEYAWQTTSCDPCPVPPLQPSDLYTLGADVLLGGPKPTDDGPMPGTRGRSAPPGGFFGGFSSWVLTRLHTRYDKTTLSEDITLVQAKPVVGGRAQWDGKALEGAGEVKMDSVNNFQGRYIIRHYWEGAVACQNPVYDRWGGPPGGDRPLQMATDLANAPRGQVTLKTAVRSSLPQLGLPGLPAPKRGK
jgi:hypothetical protein